MSEGAAQNGGTQAAAAGEAAAAVPAAVTATAAAAAAPVANGAVAATPVPAAPVAAAPMPAAPVANPVHVVVAAPAAVAVAAPAPAHHKDDEDCKPKKVAAKDDDKALLDDADQNLAQPADGCVLPADGQVAAPAPVQEPAPVLVDDGEGGGISSGLLIGAGVLAAIGVGVLALSGDKDKNGAPVANPDTGAVNEGASLTGSVATNDSDPDNDTLTYTLTGTAPAGLTLNSNGSYTFDANNAAYNSLAAGQTQVVTANYSVTDPDGATATSTLTITVTGTNDAPVAVADTNTATENGAVVTGSVATNDSDPDQGQTATLTYTLNAPVAGLTLNTNGTYSFDPNDPAYNSLGAGQTQQVVANYTVKDATGATATSTLTITVTGVNDAPVAVADTAAVLEDATVTGNLRTNDTDADANAALTYSVVGTAPAGFTLNPDGTFSFNAANAAYQSLAAGQTQNVVVNYQVSDGTATSTSTLTITVTGVNDAPVAVNDTAAATEGGAVVTGNLAVNDTDVDAGTTLTYALAAPVPGLTVNANGTFSFDPTNAAYNSLAAGATQVVNATVNVSDGQGGTTTSTLAITVTGTNDAPIAVADTNAGLEDTQITGSVATNDSDPDAGAVLTYSVVGAAPAGFTLNADGTYTLDTTNAAYQPLAAGEVQNVVVNYQVSDGTATSTSTLTIAVTGTADGPVLVNASLDVDDSAANPATLYVIPTGADTASFNYTDLVGTANFVQVNGFGGDDIINFDTAAANVSFASLDYFNDGSANDLRITVNNNGVVSDVILAGAVPTGSLIFNEATAEAAIGPDFDNFRFTDSTSNPPPVVGDTAASLDVDNNSNPNDYRTFDASLGSFQFTDDADTANNAIIVGLGSDDRIVLEAGNDYSFSTRDNDGDGLGNDLIITLNKGGVVSEIILKDAVVNNVLVYNEATAEQALGNIDYFSFA